MDPTPPVAKPFPRENLRIWSVDPLEKVFQETLPPADAPTEIVLDAARGEVVSGQVALRITGMTHAVYTTSGCGIDQVVVEPLRRQGASARRRGSSARRPSLAAAIPVERRWVGHTFVPAPAGGVDASRLEGQTPGLYPDPLYPVYETQTHPHHYNPDHSAAVMNDRTRALWLTVRVPRNAQPGEYRTEVRFKIAYFGDVITVPVRLTVHAASLPAKGVCGIENWFAIASIPRQHQCGWFDRRFWELVEAYLLNLADHRQTHVVVPMYELIEFKPGSKGSLRLGWGRFDRFVRLALKCGLRVLTGNHLATYTYDGRYKCGVHTFVNDGGEVRYELHEGRTPRAQEFLAWFLPQLRKHLRERRWLGKWWQHVRDEPYGIREDYDAIRALLKNCAPEFRTIDALNGPIVEACDCWVPVLDGWHQNAEFFRGRLAAGDTVWTYVCCGPTGKYANRFIDQKSVLPRLIFWIMARYGAQGYLHWGYNWSDRNVPEIDTCVFLPSQGPVQSGDVCVVYPGPHGPHDSIRWEMQREGAQDYELFTTLAKKDPAAAEAILTKIVRNFDEYDTSVAAFRAARKELLERLSNP